MAATYQKVKRGMVFWFNLDEQVDKNADPAIVVDGVKHHDYRQYGSRHWLVVSNDDGNESSPTCNIVPITGSNNKTVIPTHVPIMYRNKKFEILCEQMMTVNIVSLTEHAYNVSDAVMERVEHALQVQYKIRQKESLSSSAVTALLKHIESKVDEMVLSIMEKYAARIETISGAAPVKGGAAEKQFRHASLRIPQNSQMSQVEKFNTRYPGAASHAETAPVAVKTEKMAEKRNHWTEANMKQYLKDTETLSPMLIKDKWGLKDIQTVYSMKYYIQNRMEKLLEAK